MPCSVHPCSDERAPVASETQSSKAGIHLGFLSHRAITLSPETPLPLVSGFCPVGQKTRLEQHCWELGLDMLVATESVNRSDRSFTIQKGFLGICDISFYITLKE